jgi:hypothetical protein
MLNSFLLSMLNRYPNDYEGWKKEALERGFTEEEIKNFCDELFSKIIILKL